VNGTTALMRKDVGEKEVCNRVLKREEVPCKNFSE
jgi:hypothetical protein